LTRRKFGPSDFALLSLFHSGSFKVSAGLTRDTKNTARHRLTTTMRQDLNCRPAARALGFRNAHPPRNILTRNARRRPDSMGSAVHIILQQEK